jgi:asparagine synthase (glutamine-hydrolysing)
MCGIAGLLMPEGRAPETSDLRAMAAALAHRGPDDEGLHVDGRVGLAHRRLSILDLSAAGHQPLPNEDETVWVSYNGQLYGFEDVRARLEGAGHRFRSHTDTEVLVHLYEEEGPDLVASIDGMYAFALWDARERRLVLVRDRLGIKPLYYAEHDGALAFASELKALLALPWLPREADPAALVQYLYQSSVPGTACALRGVRKLPPGHRLIASGSGVRVEAYWTLPDGPAEPMDLRTAALGLEERLSAAVRTHLVADVPVGAFLSGGLDSAAVTAGAVEARGDGLPTFSVRFADAPREDEGPAAQETARLLHTTHRELVLEPTSLLRLESVVDLADEPFAISSALALHALARFAREHVKVVLTGDGADEVLAGYPWRHEPAHGLVGRLRLAAMLGARSRRAAQRGGPGFVTGWRRRLERLLQNPGAHYASLVSAVTPDEMRGLLRPEHADLAATAWASHPVALAYDAARGDAVNRRLRADLATTLVDEMLTKVDRMTMSAGLEARVPFLDRAVVEWAARVPGPVKIRGGVGKRPLRRLLEGPLAAVARRPKHGFDVPLGAWFRGPWRELLRDNLSPERIRRRGLLDPAAVSRIADAHLLGRGDHSRLLFSILVLELWLSRTLRS